MLEFALQNGKKLFFPWGQVPPCQICTTLLVLYFITNRILQKNMHWQEATPTSRTLK